MAKSATKVAKPSKAESKAVKNGGVTKSSQTPKAKAKDAAKATAKNIEKKKKKVVEPESSDSDSESESEASSGSDSDSDASEDEAPKKPVTNGKKAKAAESSDSDSDEEEDSDDSDSDSDESEEEKAAPKTNGKKAEADSDDSDSDSDSDESEEEKAAPKTNGAKKADADSDSDDSEEDSDDSDSDSDEEETKTEAPSKKRKAEDEIDEAPKKAKADVDAPTTLFAGSLSWGVDDDALYEAFKSFGNLVGARVVTDKNTGRSRGFGYVDFGDAESATKAYEAMQGQEVDGRALNLDYANAKPAEANPQNRAADRAKRHGDTLSAESDTLFVGNLPFDTEQDAVREFFGEVAEVASVRLPTDPESGNLKGFGYVTFNSIEDAKTALDAKNGAAIGNGRMSRAVRLDFAGSRPPQNGGGGGFGGRGGGRGGFGGRGGGRGGPRGGGGRGGFGGRGGGRGGFNSPRGGGGGGFSGTKISFD